MKHRRTLYPPCFFAPQKQPAPCRPQTAVVKFLQIWYILFYRPSGGRASRFARLGSL